MSAHIRWTISIQELPPELLVYIFHLVRDASLDDSLDRQSGRAFDLHWIKVSFVSRSWRELAIATPSLWSHIDLTMPHVAVEMLRRSQTAPLHLHTCFNPPASFDARKPVWLIARRSISRVRELDLPMIDSNELELLTQNIDVPALILESILIRHAWSTRPLSLTRFFERKMPSLRVLCIENFIIPRPLPAFPQLVLLKLHGTGNGLLTALETLSSLEAMPMLEDVELFRMSTPGTASSALAWHNPVNLPKLQSFTIDTVDLDAIHIVNAIRYPTEAAIDITCDKSRFTEATIEATVDICSRLRSHQCPIYSAQIYYVDFTMCLDFRIDNATPLSLVFSAVALPGPPGMLLGRLSEVLPWESIEIVTINLTGLPESWAAVVALWSGVKEVLAHVPDPSHLPKFFEGLRDALPRFETLALWDCEVEPGIPSLVDMLRHRKACGLPVPSISLNADELVSLNLDEVTRLTTVRVTPQRRHLEKIH